jgi:hypothetical protein
MQSSSNLPVDSANNEVKNTNENHDDPQAPPPTYRSIIDKLENYNDLTSLPPTYTDITNPSVVYVNNYPGPPLTDGVVQIITSNHNSVNQDIPIGNILSKKMRTYLAISGIITIVFGLIAIGLQIGLLASHSIVYYYYGFWAGTLIISIGISTIMLNNRYRTYDLSKYFRSFICQAVFLAVVFGFGIIIILTDTCDEDTSDDDGNDDACKHSYKILNGFLLTVIGFTFVQSIINTLIIGYLKRRSSINSIVIS